MREKSTPVYIRGYMTDPAAIGTMGRAERIRGQLRGTHLRGQNRNLEIDTRRLEYISDSLDSWFHVTPRLSFQPSSGSFE